MGMAIIPSIFKVMNVDRSLSDGRFLFNLSVGHCFQFLENFMVHLECLVDRNNPNWIIGEILNVAQAEIHYEECAKGFSCR